MMFWNAPTVSNDMAHRIGECFDLFDARAPVGSVDRVPGGADAHELATDLGCIIAGFGIFQLQATDDLGWSGYMSQDSRAYALAVSPDKRGLGQDAVSEHLSGRCNR